MSFYDPYGSKSFGKVREVRPGGSKSATKKSIGRVQSRSRLKPAPESILKESLSVAPVRSRNEFNGTVAQRASSNKSLDKTYSMHGKIKTVDPNLEVNSSDIIGIAKQVLQNAQKYNEEKLNFKEIEDYKNIKRIYHNEQRKLQNDMFFFESEIRDAVNKVDNVKSHLKDSISKASLHAKNTLNNKKAPSTNCKYSSNFRENFIKSPIVQSPNSASDDLDFLERIGKPRSILKFSAARESFPKDKKNNLNEIDSEVSIRHLDYDDSFTLPPTRKLKSSIHKFLSPKRSKSENQKQISKPTKFSFTKKKDSIEESLKKADEKIKEIRSMSRPPSSANIPSKTKLLKKPPLALSRTDSVRSQNSLQCGSQKSVTFSDMIKEQEIKRPNKTKLKNPFELKYDFEKIIKQDDYGKLDKAKSAMDDVREIMKTLEKPKTSPKQAKKGKEKESKPLPSFTSRSNNFTTQTEMVEPSTHGTQTFIPTVDKSSYYDATKSQFLVKDLEENLKIPAPNIDDLLAIDADDHGKYLSKLKCKYPRFFLTKKEDHLLSDIKLQSRMKELEQLENCYDDTNSRPFNRVASDDSFNLPDMTAIGRAMKAASSSTHPLNITASRTAKTFNFK